MMSVAVRRAHSGLGVLACLSAATLPLWLWVGTAHLAHWSGGEDAAAWRGVMGPWAGRLWSALAVVSLVGWGGYFPVDMPDGRSEWSTALTVGALGLLTWAVCGVPGWFWLAQVGHLPGGEVFGTATLALVPAVGALGVVICSVMFGQRQAGVIGGLASGALLLWVCGGWF